MKRAIPVIAAALAVMSAAAEKQPFDRYQSIVDRQMFGPLPPGFDPTKSPNEVSKGESAAAEKQLTQEQEKLQSSIHFSVINVTPDGKTAVGFTDNSDPKAPVHYYLKVGEVRNGWEVKEADAIAATMTIAKGEIEVTLKLGGNSAKDGGTKKAGTNGSALLAGNRPGTGSLGSRRRMRREAEVEQLKAERERLEKAKADAAAKDAERQQREAERQERDRQEREAQRQQLQQLMDEIKQRKEAKTAEEHKPEGDGNAEN